MFISVIREVKGVGGLDSVGQAFGDDIEERVKQELEAILSRHEAEAVGALSV